MAQDAVRQTARILELPASVRLAAARRAEARRAQAEQHLPQVVVGEAWYHAEAIRDAERSPRR